MPESSNQYDSDFKRLIQTIKPTAGDPTYLTLKAHLLAEEVLYRFLESQAHRPESLGEARLGFSQLIAVSRALHLHSKSDWWGWTALKKLNSLRNLLAHNLEPKDLKDRIVDFSVYVAESIGATTESEIGQEYENLATKGTHPFLLAVVALHMATCATLGFTGNERWSAIQSE
jgi:hypothetical protein